MLLLRAKSTYGKGRGGGKGRLCYPITDAAGCCAFVYQCALVADMPIPQHTAGSNNGGHHGNEQKRSGFDDDPQLPHHGHVPERPSGWQHWQ
jgi:hypothetical protein